ncbi:hypothetical protein B0H34DRAFT_650320 [Crassisporium funariophilum]|nr:hypothetical protein B0H34DRAFT_650320 [Crassisporium funariophilum]
MTRQLRPRKNTKNYAVLAGFETDEDERRPGPSTAAPVIVVDENDSEDDFDPEQGTRRQNELEPADPDEDVDSVAAHVEISPIPQPTPAPAKEKGKGKVKAGSTPNVPKRQNYVLPTPSVQHRHRAVPIYSRGGRGERLAAEPSLFGTPTLTLTNGFTESSKVMDRVNKSWGYNVGSGPLWDLSEDRGWYKEAVAIGNNIDTEAKRRPRVYPNVRVQEGWKVISIEDAAPYLPSDDVTTEEGNLRPPPDVPCFFGPFKSQTRRDLKMFETFAMAEYNPESNAHVLNSGGPVWGLDWCPTHSDDRPGLSHKQYLAVAPFPSQSHSPDIGRKVARPSFACIQIWALSAAQPLSKPVKKSSIVDYGEMNCELVLCIDSGPAYELKWCPLPSHDSVNTDKPSKLGLLAGTFQDGSFAVYVVPKPSNFKTPGHGGSQPLQHPILRIELEETCCWTFDWGNSSVVAIGTTNGTIAVYDIGPALNSYTDPSCPTITDILPTHYLAVHQSAIRALAWIRAPPSWPSGAPRLDQDPTVIASGGYDGMECMTDIREGLGSVMNRTRDVINTLAFSPFAGGPITIDHENTVKAYSASPSMLGRGHSLLEPQGPVWSVHASDFHPQLAVGASDGTCSTTNTLRSTRRGGSVPFLVYKIFQMDYNRNKKEYRMLDRFLPQESLDRPAVSRVNKGKAKANEPTSTGAWPREVGVHRVVWNNGNGLASSSLLAAGTASGLCRVDSLWGRWIKDKIPYGSVEGIRMEDATAMDVDTEESEGESD